MRSYIYIYMYIDFHRPLFQLMIAAVHRISGADYIRSFPTDLVSSLGRVNAIGI